MDQEDIYYAGADGGVKTALRLAGYSLVDDPAQADVIVLNGKIPDAGGIAERVKDGAGLVLILGEGASQDNVQKLLGTPITTPMRAKP